MKIILIATVVGVISLRAIPIATTNHPYLVPPTHQTAAGYFVGNQLRAPHPALRYQWLRCDRHGKRCHLIRFAGQRRYTLRLADVGHRIVVLMYLPRHRMLRSRPTPVIKLPRPVNTYPPYITGTPRVGQTLTVHPGNWLYVQ